MRSFTTGLRVLALLVLTSAIHRADGYEEFREQALDGLVESLHGYAEWCAKEKLYAERDTTWRLVLEFDTDDAVARKGLGYKREKDGSWKEPRAKRPPKNHNKEALALAPAEKAKAVSKFSERLFAFYDQGNLTVEEKERLLTDVIYLDTENARARELRGEVKQDESWVLVETVQAKEGRQRIRAHVRAGYEKAPAAEAIEPTEAEKKLGLPWSAAVKNDVVRVLGTGDLEECEVVARAIHATHHAFAGILGKPSKLPAGFTVFLLQNHDEGMTFLENHPDISDDQLSTLAVLEGTGIQSTGDFAQWGKDPVRRRDAVVRYAIGWMVQVAFGVNMEEGWVFEGLGLYLGRECIGTRLTWFVQPASFMAADEEAALRARLLDGKTNWMDEALTTLSKDGRPALSAVMAKALDELTTPDLLFAYVASAYLLETRSSEEIAELLKRIGSGMRGSRAIAKTFDLAIDTMDKRIVRWLSERR